MMLKKSIRSLIKSAVVWGTNRSFIQAFAHEFNKREILFLAYHGVVADNEEFDSWTLVRETVFRKQMEFLKGHFDCLSIDEALTRNVQDAKRPGVVVTFDDGYANNVEIAFPILLELNIPVTIYISTKYVLERKLFWPDTIWMAAKRSGLSSIDLREIAEPLGSYKLNGNYENWLLSVLKIVEDLKKISPDRRDDILRVVLKRFLASQGKENFRFEVENNAFTPMTENQIRQLACEPLITIGAHSHCHNLLDQIPQNEAKKSILKSKEVLESLAGNAVEHFAYPNGNFNDNLLRVVKDIGFKSAVTYRRGFFSPSGNTYAINRFGVSANISMSLFKTLSTGFLELKAMFKK